MPEIVKNGRAGMPACASCHQPNGVGRPENAALAGLTETYIKQQLRNFRRGVRKGSEPRRSEQALMAALAANLTDAEVDEAAKYFASLKPASFVKVVETDTVPKAPDGGTEPIGKRIVEVPENLKRVETGDSRTPFIAYVPKGSIAKGEALVTNGDGKTVQCMSCHGAGLHGSGDVPRLAGQSPTYLVRQLYDLQQGKRSGAIAPMQPVVDALDVDDMIAIAAYAASRE